MDYPVKPGNDVFLLSYSGLTGVSGKSDGGDKQIARSSRAMTERGKCQVITVRESSRIMTVYCVGILSSDYRAKSESPGGFEDFSGDRH